MADLNDNEHQFRKTKIYPTVEDIRRSAAPELLPNLIHKCYESCDHYLKTHFDLLREELVQPLVEDIKALKVVLNESKGNKEVNTNGYIRAKSLKEVIESKLQSKVYFDVKLIEPFVNPRHGLVLRFSFDHSLLLKIDLLDSQILMDGSLLCLSSDNFEHTFIFGRVVNSRIGVTDERTHQKCWDFCLKLDFDNNLCKDLLKVVFKRNAKYKAIETVTYFEGFRHSLTKLQEMRDNFPLDRYIVELNTAIKAPNYLKPDTTYDMNDCIPLRKPKATDNGSQVPASDQNDNPLSAVKLLDQSCKPLLTKLSTFDVKQLDAFYTALTKEFAVIQGPPGTGKTFVGLKIVKCLLDNEKVWNGSQTRSPILIVCYKNHALDQFLEGIIKFNGNVVRIGGNSESKELEEYKLRSIEDQFKTDLKAYMERFDCNDSDVRLISKAKSKIWKHFARVKDLRNSLDQLFLKIEWSFTDIIAFKDIEPYIKPKKFCNELIQEFSDDGVNPIYLWLRLSYDDQIVEGSARVDFNTYLRIKLSQKQLNDETFDVILEINKMSLKDMNSKEKWILYLFWRKSYSEAIKRQIRANSQTISEEIEKFDAKRVKFNRLLCNKSLIIGLTITGAAKHRQLVEAFAPKIMIIEEAAEVLEGHVVAAMPSSIEHLILIGDHKQLRPITNVRELTDKYDLDKSLFERMVLNGMPFVQLELQHRMRPCISELLKVGGIYKTLRNSEKVTKYPDIDYTHKKNMYFIDHKHIEDSNNSRDIIDKSRSNLYEAKYVVELAKYLLLHKYPDDGITILTTYNAQLDLIKHLMFEQKNFFVKEKKRDPFSPQTANTDAPTPELRIRVSSVDGFQGEENNIIIISFVRSSKKDTIGFLSTMNRVNVALSRARHGLYCIGNFAVMAKESPEMWGKIVDYLREKDFIDEKFTIGCKCTGDVHIEMPGQFEMYNLQIKNGRCSCPHK